jgi:heterodisulfide reductase subunit C
MEAVDTKDLDPRFKHEVAERPGGENIKLCFACGTCTAGCPVAGIDDDFNPRRIIRQVLLGMRREVLASPALWRCVQCYACYAKCPQNVKFRDVVRALRDMAVAAGHVDPSVEDEVRRLDRFSQTVRRNLVSALLADRARYDRMRADVEKAVAGQ